MKTPLTKVRIKHKDGTVFEGTAKDCAERMLWDAYADSHRIGGIGDMILGDFCKEFGMELIREPFGQWYIRTCDKSELDQYITNEDNLK